MTKEEVIRKITENNPGKKIEALLEFPDTYVYRFSDDEPTGLVNWKAVNKSTGEFEMRSFFDTDDNHMTKII